MTQAIDYKHVSILWAGAEKAGSWPSCIAAFSTSPGNGGLRVCSSHPGSTAFLARLGTPAEMVGFVVGQLAADEAEILSLGVRADRQRHGIGRKLVEALARAVKKAEARRLFLEVGTGNAAALGLYQSLGFQEVWAAQGLLSAPGRKRRGRADTGP